jgi:hypothetical protein
MKLKFIFHHPFVVFAVGATLSLNVFTCSADRSEAEHCTAASSSYGILAEKSLDLLARFDLDTWGTMLSDSVVYYFPDGDAENGKKVSGKKAVLAWWKRYITSSGMRSMSIENASYVPIYVKEAQRTGEMPGTQVIAYFSNRMVYESGTVSVKMNFVIHFDKWKMIDGYYTYYDRTPIIKVLKEKSNPGEFAANDHPDVKRKNTDI